MNVDFFLNTNKGLVKVNSSEIHCIESCGKCAKVVTARGDFNVTNSLSQLEREVLPEVMFCRIHRSFIVPLCNIRPLDNDEVIIYERKFPVEKPYRAKLLSSLNIIW
ncbi:LytTr DNA-binding domain-containing protein [Chitinophaga sp. YR573]|uniref:LytR/AlgR family response regulator transcription factor n=1 Tax=Chitinophaga sp. YR573 TaxID=1881040 RepID=UPI0008AFFDA7|nr:LytTr DNA-binding domain-containing protein [Chitinophaga sp. YR573]